MDSSKKALSSFKASIARALFFRALFLASAISILSLLRFLPTLHFLSLSQTHLHCLNQSHEIQNTSTTSTLEPGSYLFQSRVYNSFWDSFNCIPHANLTLTVVNHLLRNGFLNHKATSLCLGEPSPMAVVSAMQQLGFTTVTAVPKNTFFSLRHNTIVCHLHYQDCSFDFVLSKDVDKVSAPAPALLLLEVERILKPGGIGAVLVGSSNNAPSSTSVSSMLRSSSVVHVALVNDLTLVVFKKRSSSSLFFYQHLEGECPSLNSTKPLIELMEPLLEETERPKTSQEHEKRISYLPKFVDMSNRKRLVYIDIGVGGVPNNVTNWFLPSYPVDFKDFNVYFVHYNTSILLSHVKGPGITFVYHPGLSSTSKATDRGLPERFIGEGEEFDFHAWFKETVQHADFVALKMNAGNVEMKFLRDMFESGTICFVNELFLSCSGNKDEKSCMDVYRGLRDGGVYVHQWWDTDELHEGSNK
ncbi:hypothetical protein PIB30_086752 [Stylosanthes scabra]|uniref:Methyltransferase type 11 domain-containing protein n=1 Tax=Stylosanthes scabra TaxID=79078 RepID=A0ABU6QTR6_9FABA|nr:hypothetical protein [Stylosanthes scabra]